MADDGRPVDRLDARIAHLGGRYDVLPHGPGAGAYEGRPVATYGDRKEATREIRQMRLLVAILNGHAGDFKLLSGRRIKCADVPPLLDIAITLCRQPEVADVRRYDLDLEVCWATPERYAV